MSSRAAVKPIRSAVLSAAALLWLAGCAASPAQAPPKVESGLTWAGYLYGEDLRMACGSEQRDRFRMVFNADRPGGAVNIFEVSGRPDTGGTMDAWTLGVSSVSQLGPGEPVPAEHAIHSIRIDGPQFLALAMRLIEAGVFTPPHSQLNLGASKLRWFATGCLDGYYFLSAYARKPGTIADIAWQPNRPIQRR